VPKQPACPSPSGNRPQWQRLPRRGRIPVRPGSAQVEFGCGGQVLDDTPGPSLAHPADRDSAESIDICKRPRLVKQ